MRPFEEAIFSFGAAENRIANQEAMPRPTRFRTPFNMGPQINLRNFWLRLGGIF